MLELKNFTYLDIGANHPFRLNNTAMFYKMGFSGVIVEPDPMLFNILKRKRSRDTVLHLGITLKPSDGLDFFLMDPPTLNTFSEDEARRYAGIGHSIKEKIKVPCLNVMEIMEKYFSKPPNFVSIDCEGLDVEILQSIYFARIRPEIICIETLEYTSDLTGRKISAIPALMEEAGYTVFADTYINTIFVDKERLKQHK
jgi:FkbM family methyltransferase